MSISLLLALYLVFSSSLFNRWPAFLFSIGVETLQIDGYLTLSLLTHGNLAVFHRLMKYVDPMVMAKAHPSLDTYSYKSVAGLKTLLREYLLMQIRHLTGEETESKTREQALEI